MRFKDFLYRAPAWELLLLPIALLVLIVAIIFSFFPSGAVGRYAAFAFIFSAILVSRMLRMWEWGAEVFHFLTFCVTFVFGLFFGLTVTFVMSMVVLYLLSGPRAHYLTYGTVSILIQSFGLFVNVLFSSALSFLYPGAAASLPYFGTGVIFVALLVDKFLTNRFVGIDWGRLSVSMLVDIVLNYNLFLIFGAGTITFLSQL